MYLILTIFVKSSIKSSLIDIDRLIIAEEAIEANAASPKIGSLYCCMSRSLLLSLESIFRWKGCANQAGQIVTQT
jgi:hypothetical protein